LILSIQYDDDYERYEIVVTAYGNTEPAGPRLYRAPPHPRVQFKHDTMEGAQAALTELNKYFDGLKNPTRKKDKKPEPKHQFS
jgi:hypothetical protein